jgi:hypothetical protein
MSAPRRSLTDHVRTSCTISGDPTTRLNDPDPLLACRLPCAVTDSGTLFVSHLFIIKYLWHIFCLPIGLSRDFWMPDGTVCQADTSLTSFCVRGRCEPFLCPTPSLGENADDAGYPFLLHEGRCQTAPSLLLPNRPPTDKEQFKSRKATTTFVDFTDVNQKVLL